MLEIPSLRSSRSTKIVQQNSQGESRWDAVCKDSRGGARGLKAKKRAEVRRWLGKESRGGAKRFSAPKKPEVGRRAGKDSRGGAMSVFFKRRLKALIAELRPHAGNSPADPPDSAETESPPAAPPPTNRACFPDDARSTRQIPSNQS